MVKAAEVASALWIYIQRWLSATSFRTNWTPMPAQLFRKR